MPTSHSRSGQHRSARTRLTAAVAAVATAAVVATASLAGSVATADPASAGQSCGRADFADAPRGSGFYQAISWMACEKISVGYADNTFRKNKAVTRGEVAAFLYRQVTPSHPKSTARYFTDVNPGGANYQAITWFAQDGISVGYQDRTFRPNQPVTRGELAAFLHRLADEPAAGGASFRDMRPGAAFSVASAWLRTRGITSGYGDGTFRPGNDITRAETASFLYEAAGALKGRGNVVTPALRPLDETRASSTVATWKAKAVNWATTKAKSTKTYYQYGGNGPYAFDCSGFTTGAFSAGGASLPRSSKSQYTAADSKVPLSRAKPGDLVYWSNNGSSSGVYHVAIVVEGGKIAHARNPTSGVTLTDLDYSPANMLPQAGRFD
ncbi:MULTISPECIES: S-layer homology domain-containing protein [Micrococcaceae]|uniref:S-layer homology domain-containing protein n=1 Tax=Micrococcaceae TaxID=1268 RepID=UPI0016226928|nr:S-layer homology domain-containing protein [Citricoccus sp.]MBB5748215.1 cell wall-associated NlpC family hydrolase [Micrococcus sp. TA1]HRO30637.1 S-layer homology domain-containing protein [Citricoccus sp.]HRO94576.1 S-layer homology domain-containing protein [Citricoccus sp.]